MAAVSSLAERVGWASARFIWVMPSLRYWISCSFSRSSASRLLKARASTPISSPLWTATAPLYEPSRARSTSPTRVRTGPVMRRAPRVARPRAAAMTASETITRLLRNCRKPAISRARLRSATTRPSTRPETSLSGACTAM